MKALGTSVYSICKDCAIANGAIPPKLNCATLWTANCDVCREYKGLCDVSDWDWPTGNRPKTWTLMRRDDVDAEG